MVDFNKINRNILAIGRKIKRHFYLHDDVNVLVEELYAVHRDNLLNYMCLMWF